MNYPEFLGFVVLGLVYILWQDRLAILEHLKGFGEYYQKFWGWIREGSLKVIKDEEQYDDAWTTHSLMMLVVGAYVLSLSLGYEGVVSQYGFVPALAGEAWRWITHIFLHSSYPIELAPFSLHLLYNLAFFYWFGDNVEHWLAKVKYDRFGTDFNVYAGLFLIWGIIAAAVQASVAGWSSTVIMIGASGAIAGVMGFYFVMFPDNKVWVGGKGPVPAQLFLGLWFISQFALQDASVATFAHVGGFLSGLVSAILFKKVYEHG